MNNHTSESLFNSIKELKQKQILLLKEEIELFALLSLKEIERFKNSDATPFQLIEINKIFVDRNYELKQEIVKKEKELANLCISIGQHRVSSC